MSGIFVINGFYASMREVYTKPEATIHWYDVEYDSADSSWENFRGVILGATDPATATVGALRRLIFDTWESLGLASEPNVGDNGVHASASPFEGLAERLNWLGADLKTDPFGQALLAAGLSEETILAWTKDPQVELKEGGMGSLFDQVEDQSVEECVATLQGLAGVSAAAPANLKNRAFLFIKPHANLSAVRALVAEKLGEAKISILAQGDLTGTQIDENQYIDNHYLSIALKASLKKPAELNPPSAGLKKFEDTFGLTWAAAQAQGRMFNAVDACKLTGLDGNQLNTLWAFAKKNKFLAKLSGGFYAGLIPVLSLPACVVSVGEAKGVEAKDVEAKFGADRFVFTEDNYGKLINLNGITVPTVSTQVINGVTFKETQGFSAKFVLNGFYAGMRSKFTDSTASIHWMDVEYDTKDNTWEAFRGTVLGATDPATAAEGSLRRLVFDTWESLGLSSEPNVGDNGVHASASPFEGLAERLNWLAADLKTDSFGAALLSAGLSEETILAWSKDPQVELKDGSKGSLFDQVEDQSVEDCVATLQGLAGVEVKAVEGLKNRAFLFIKPHADNKAVADLVRTTLGAASFTVLAEGDYTGAQIDENKYIDNHYYSIAYKAALVTPDKLNPPPAGLKKFQDHFGISWTNANKLGFLFNAVDGQKALGMTGDGLDAAYSKAKKNKHLVKLSGGFYSGRIIKFN